MSEKQLSGSQPSEVKGIRGWLILPAIGLVITPIRMAIQVKQDLLPALEPETWSVLTTPGTEAYHPLWAPLITFEVVANMVVFGITIWLLVLFFRKSKLVPKLFVSWLLLLVAIQILDHSLATRIPAVATFDDTMALGDLARSIVGAVIWVPYFLVSKRVKNTFVERVQFSIFKHLILFVIASLIVAVISAIFLDKPISSATGVGYIIGRALGTVAIAGIVAFIPAGIYWLIKRKTMPGLSMILWVGWAIVSVLHLVGNFMSR